MNSSEKSFSLITELIADQPDCAKGTTDGAFMPGNSFEMASMFSFFVFKTVTKLVVPKIQDQNSTSILLTLFWVYYP